MTTIAELHIGDNPLSWQAIGLDVDAGHTCHVGHVRLRFHPEAEQRGIFAWTLAGTPDETVPDVDGLDTRHGEPPSLAGLAASHLLGVTNIDHLVVMTPDVDRTVTAVQQRLGLPLRRTREGEAYGRKMRQAFFRMGEVVLEVVGPPAVDPSGGGASFFGLAFTVMSLDEAIDFIGPDLVSEPKPAVQADRSICTVRSAAGLAVPLALMSPEPRQ
jgi:catechol 2,3-dioxygenase-like lactoylglutathione lyase family enzyme